MKKLFLTLILLSPFGMLTGMEADDIKNGIPTLTYLSTKAVAKKLIQNDELKKFFSNADYIKKLGLIEELKNSVAADIINTYPNKDWSSFVKNCCSENNTSISLMQALLLIAYHNNTVSFKQYPHSFYYFTKLSKLMQKVLIIEDKVELSLIQKFFYNHATFTKTVIAFVAVLTAATSYESYLLDEETKSSLTNFAGLSSLYLAIAFGLIINQLY